MLKSYRPIRPRESRARRITREIVGRAALALIALALLWGGYKCIRTGYAIQHDFNQQHAMPTRSPGGSGAPIAFGGVLLVLGAPLLFAAVMPIDAVEKLLGRQTNNTLYENPSASGYLRDIDSLL